MNIDNLIQNIPECNELWQSIGGFGIVVIAFIFIYFYGKNNLR